MMAFWEQLTVFEKALWFIALSASTVFLVQLLLSFLGLHTDHDDIDAPGEMDGGFHIFTIKNFMAFLTLFGWTGLACFHSGMGAPATVGLGTLAGLAAMFMVAGLFYFTGKLGEDATFDAHSAVGKQAKVYIPIPSARSGTGKVQLALGSVRELDAVTPGDKLATGTPVRITAVQDGSTVVVERI
jgi:membrane protein implicated in regulation of membrane protease activity